MDSTIVIKVKFGKTLRRFNGCVSEAGKLELSLNGLLEKVLSLFSLSPDVDITLTYLDEDGDSVTLADEEDLNDAMRQFLNPLRITVKVNSDQGNISSNARSSGSSTANRSPRVTQPMPDLSRTVSEIFKAVPEPLGEALSKLSLDLASKATASSPQLPELVQQFSKMLQSCVIPGSDSQADNVAANQSAGAESPTPPPLAKEPVALGGDSLQPKVVAAPKSANPPVRYEKRTGAKCAAPWMKEPGECSLNAEAAKPAWVNIKADKDVMKPRWGLNPPGVGQCPFSGTLFENEPVIPSAYFSPRMHPFKRSFSHGGVARILHRGVQCDGCGVHPISGPRFKSKVKEDYDLCSICYTEMGSEADYVRMDRPVHRHGGVAGILHRGVGCDGCGVHPISGPRFKSKVKENYDLCSICFAEMGSVADYIRMDRPVHRHPHLLKRLDNLKGRVIPPPNMPQVLRFVKPKPPKLESRFIMDVNVIDGTMMAPSTPFTKIWRMRNNGTLFWPHGTHVTWIGGDRLGASPSAALQIPFEGLAAEKELEIAVDFKAPELPGRYISYWRMAAPSGQNFGQRFWVLIQVDASARDSAHNDNWQGLNMNLPPESSGLNEAESESNNVVPIVVDARLPINEPSNNATYLGEPLDVPLPTKNQDLDNVLYKVETESNNAPVVEPSNSATDLVEPLDLPLPTKNQDLDSGLYKVEIESNNVPIAVDGRHPINEPSNKTTDLVEPLNVPLPTQNQDLDFPINDNLFVNGTTGPMWGRPPTVSYPTVDSSDVPQPMPPAFAESLARAIDEDDVEQILLMELEQMGFKQVDLNKDILRKNKYDLEQSVDDLCGVSEWDPILEELQEMGFCDDEMNKKLLKKNNGSIKGVVMDLISGEKP